MILFHQIRAQITKCIDNKIFSISSAYWWIACSKNVRKKVKNAHRCPFPAAQSDKLLVQNLKLFSLLSDKEREHILTIKHALCSFEEDISFSKEKSSFVDWSSWRIRLNKLSSQDNTISWCFTFFFGKTLLKGSLFSFKPHSADLNLLWGQLVYSVMVIVCTKFKLVVLL